MYASMHACMYMYTRARAHTHTHTHTHTQVYCRMPPTQKKEKKEGESEGEGAAAAPFVGEWMAKPVCSCRRAGRLLFYFSRFVFKCCVCACVQSAKISVIHTMSHHHTYYVTSSYILCHIIIHTMSHHHTYYVTTRPQQSAKRACTDDCLCVHVGECLWLCTRMCVYMCIHMHAHRAMCV